MSLVSWLNRPGPIRWIWRPGYELFYSSLKSAVAILCGPMFRVRRVGQRAHLPAGGVILCPNHASYLDPAFVQLVVRRRLTFVMTNEFYQRPGGRWFFKLVGAVPVARGRLARRGLRRATALVRRGYAVVLFPEGRLSQDGTLGRARRGVAVMARKTRAPVYPVAIAGSMRAWPRGARRPGRAHVRIAFGKPARWSATNDRSRRAQEQDFADHLMRRIQRLKRSVERAAPVPASLGGTPPGRPA